MLSGAFTLGSRPGRGAGRPRFRSLRPRWRHLGSRARERPRGPDPPSRHQRSRGPTWRCAWGDPYGLEVTAVLRSFERLLCQWAPKMSHFWTLEMSHFRGCPAGSGAARLEPEGPHEAAFPAGGLGFGSGPERMDRLGKLGVAPHPASALTRYARGHTLPPCRSVKALS